MSEKITAITGGSSPDKLAESVRQLRQELVVRVEYAQIMAKLARAQFLAFKEEGFTDAQALELVKGSK